MKKYLSANDIANTCKELLEEKLKKKGYDFYKLIDVFPEFVKVIFKNLNEKLLIIVVEPREGLTSVDLLTGDFKDNNIANEKYLILEMKAKGANLQSARTEIPKLTKTGDWLVDRINHELIFIDKFGDLVL